MGVVRCSSNCRLMWSTNKNIKKLSQRAVWFAGAEASVQCLTVTGCIKGRKHRASPVLLALFRGCLHNCAATSVSPALLLNGSATAHHHASWPSIAGGGSAIHWRHFLPWCPGTLSGGNNAGRNELGPQRAAPTANPNAFLRRFTGARRAISKKAQAAARGG